MNLRRLILAAFEAAAAVCALIAVSPSWGQPADGAATTAQRPSEPLTP